MKFYNIIFFILGALPFAIAQEEDNDTFLKGQVYGGLPIELYIHTDDQGITGYSRYGSNGDVEYTIDGEATAEGLLLFELDAQNVVTGLIELDKESNHCVWNSVDYNINLPINLSNKDIESSTTIDYVSHQSYIAVKYPNVDKTFAAAMEQSIGDVVKEIVKEYSTVELENDLPLPSLRFKRRSIGVNKVTLDTQDLISGMLTFYNNQKSEVTTITYSYDKEKKEMLDLSKIFKKSFNYSFFLKQYINQKKDKMKGLMSPLESSWLKASAFNQYVLTQSGLKFFNDYNTVFGRKSFTIPYHEISSSIQQKSIAQYIKKRK